MRSGLRLKSDLLGQDYKFEMKVVIDVKVEVKIKSGIEIDNDGSVNI